MSEFLNTIKVTWYLLINQLRMKIFHLMNFNYHYDTNLLLARATSNSFVNTLFSPICRFTKHMITLLSISYDWNWFLVIITWQTLFPNNKSNFKHK